LSEPKIEIQKFDNATTLAAISRVELDVVVSTAKQFPRSIAKFRDLSSEMTLSSVEFAAQSFYALPRAGKWITGPSIRFAETLQHAWGNCRAAARVTEEQEKYVVAQGVFIDCEANTMVSMEVKRRIVDKEGNRYNTDMVQTAGNAACSIALRNAILRGIPKALWSTVYDKIEGIITNPKEVDAVRAKALDYFDRKGYGAAKVCALLQVDGVEKIGPREIFLLRGLHNSIEDGDVTIEQAFKNAKAVPNMPRERKQTPTAKKPAPETAKPKPAEKAAKPAAKATAPKKNEPVAQVVKITEKQRQELFRIASRKNGDYDTVQKLVKSALTSFGFKDSYSVTIDKFEAVCTALKGEA
jgi:hypothetical protein